MGYYTNYRNVMTEQRNVVLSDLTPDHHMFQSEEYGDHSKQTCIRAFDDGYKQASEMPRYSTIRNQIERALSQRRADLLKKMKEGMDGPFIRQSLASICGFLSHNTNGDEIVIVTDDDEEVIMHVTHDCDFFTERGKHFAEPNVEEIKAVDPAWITTDEAWVFIEDYDEQVIEKITSLHKGN